ncbi:acyl-protein synthetase [Gemmatimonadota bacterium]
MTFSELSSELVDLFAGGVQVALAEDHFNDLALRIHRFQCDGNPVLDTFSRRRGIPPEELDRWEEIPAVPTRAFRSVPLVAGDPDRVERVFRTSGTTGGPNRRGEHYVMDLALYRGSLLASFEAFLLPDGASLSFLCLVPSPEEMPDSSLSFMLGVVRNELGGGGGGFYVHPTRGLDAAGLRTALLQAQERRRPALVAGTAFAFVHFLEMLEGRGWRFELPEGSRVLETGGFKGRSRVLPRHELYRGLHELLGVPVSSIVNEYGMTELLSQFYEPVLLESAGAEGARGSKFRADGVSPSPEGLALRYHRGPPWTRTRVLDSSTLEPVPSGEAGVLAHVDLANLSSSVAVLTEDMGREVEGGFRLLGRVPGAEPRGCSLAMDDFLLSAAGGP